MIDKSTENQLMSFLLEAMQQVIDDDFSHFGSLILPVTNKEDFKKCDQFELVTICSFNFKCLVMVHFSTDEEFVDLVFENQTSTYGQKASYTFLDKAGEICNVLSGALKRKLDYTFNDLGMSVPQLLSQHALDFFLEKTPDCTIDLKADIGNKYAIIASALLFLDESCEFKLNASSNDEGYLDQGDLLLF